MSAARYPTKAKITAAIQLARELGLDVAGFEISADGHIRIMEARMATPDARGGATAFDRFQDQL